MYNLCSTICTTLILPENYNVFLIFFRGGECVCVCVGGGGGQ